MDEGMVRAIAAQVAGRVLQQSGNAGRSLGAVPLEISARHVHLSQQDVEALFGPGYSLSEKRPLSQPGQFLCNERVTLLTPKGELRAVAVLGPAREHTQVELSQTDARALGLQAPVRLSGDTAGCPGIHVMSERTVVFAPESVMVAQNHIHMAPADAQRFGVHDNQRVRVRADTGRPITFEDVVVRVSGQFSLAMHIDFDEANACLCQSGDKGELLCGGTMPVKPPEPPEPVCREAAPAVRRQVICEEEAKRLCAAGERTLALQKGTLLTPSARDVLRERKIDVRYV